MLTLSQQSSFIGMRTRWTWRATIVWMNAVSDPSGPEKMPQPWMQAYSVPDLSTPYRLTGCPLVSTRRFPETCSGIIPEGGVPAGGVPPGGVGVGLEATPPTVIVATLLNQAYRVCQVGEKTPSRTSYVPAACEAGTCHVAV